MWDAIRKLINERQGQATALCSTEAADELAGRQSRQSAEDVSEAQSPGGGWHGGGEGTLGFAHRRTGVHGGAYLHAKDFLTLL